MITAFRTRPRRPRIAEQLRAPSGESVTQSVDVFADQAVLGEVFGVEQLRLGERVGDHTSVECDVR